MVCSLFIILLSIEIFILMLIQLLFQTIIQLLFWFNFDSTKLRINNLFILSLGGVF